MASDDEVRAMRRAVTLAAGALGRTPRTRRSAA